MSRGSTQSAPAAVTPSVIPEHELLSPIASGSYGEVWRARNIVGTQRAVKIVYRARFDSDRPYDREFAGIQKFEPISRSHDGVVDLLHLGRAADNSHFYYVMELADRAKEPAGGNPDSVMRDRVPLTAAAGTKIQPGRPKAFSPGQRQGCRARRGPTPKTSLC